MLKKENRLKKNSEFQKVFRKGRGTNSFVFRIKFLEKTSSLPSRFGFVVSNKTDKRASKRNMIKRLMRAETQTLISELKSGYDIVVSFQNKIELPLNKEKLRKELKELYIKSGLLRDK